MAIFRVRISDGVSVMVPPSDYLVHCTYQKKSVPFTELHIKF